MEGLGGKGSGGLTFFKKNYRRYKIIFRKLN